MKRSIKLISGVFLFNVIISGYGSCPNGVFLCSGNNDTKQNSMNTVGPTPTWWHFLSGGPVIGCLPYKKDAKAGEACTFLKNACNQTHGDYCARKGGCTPIAMTPNVVSGCPGKKT